MKTFKEYINENAKYYHGAAVSQEELDNILKTGLKYTPTIQDDDLPDPIKGNVYLTKNISIALPHTFAKRIDLTHKNLSVIFEVNKDQIRETFADEDEIGNYAVKLMNSKPESLTEFDSDFLDLVNQVLDKKRKFLQELGFDEITYKNSTPFTKKKRNAIIELGKLIYVKMSKAQHKKLVNDNYNITVNYTVKPSKAYVLNRDEVTGKITSIKQFLDKANVILA